MIYLSKGIVGTASTEQLIHVLHSGQEYNLTGIDAAMWLNGRFDFTKVESVAERQAADHLLRMGLIEAETDEADVCKYRIATRCVFCPADTKGSVPLLKSREKQILNWLKYAGVRLSVAELVYLFEHKIEASQEILYTDNRQRLIERIYTKDTISDNILEMQMEYAECRDEVITGLMRLLRKKQLIVL